MKSLNPYLHFNGDCRAALDFYKEALKGEVSSVMTYGEADPNVPASHKERIIHGLLRAGDVVIMVSDGPADFIAKPGNNVSMMLEVSDTVEQDAVFAALSRGGTVTQPLQDTFWGARFGMLVDRFGITWMLNYTKPKP